MTSRLRITKTLFALIILIVIGSCSMHSKVSHKDKKEIDEFLNRFSLALVKKDTLWLRAHTSDRSYDYYSSQTDIFSDNDQLETFKNRLHYKRKYSRRRQSSINVTFGTCSDTRGYQGGAMILKPHGFSWMCYRYKYIGK